MIRAEFDPFNMPDCMREYWISMDEQAERELREAYQRYRNDIEEMLDLEEEYSFIQMLMFESVELQAVELSVEDMKVLQRFVRLQEETANMEKIQHYILGCRHAMQFLRFIRIL